jgi:hypothetical protein
MRAPEVVDITRDVMVSGDTPQECMVVESGLLQRLASQGYDGFQIRKKLLGGNMFDCWGPDGEHARLHTDADSGRYREAQTVDPEEIPRLLLDEHNTLIRELLQMRLEEAI